MILQQGVDSLARLRALDPVSRFIQNTVIGIYRSAGGGGRRVADTLYGTWLGHPLHPSLTDVTIGAWTASFSFDFLSALTGSDSLARCADATLALGTVVAIPTAASGLTDVQHPKGQARRVGIVHGAINLGGVILQTVSLARRAQGKTASGRLLSALAFGGLLVSAYLGGELVDKFRVGVNHAPPEALPEGLVPVMRLADLPPNEPWRVNVNGTPVVLVRQGDRIYAMHATCTHLGGPLDQGAVVDGTIQCPWHGSRFALDDGQVARGPASFPEHCLETRVRNGMIEVGPGRSLGHCEHEPVRMPMPEVKEAVVPPAFR